VRSRRRRSTSGLLTVGCLAYLSLPWRAPMREPEPERVRIGISMSDLTMDQFMDIEDGWPREPTARRKRNPPPVRDRSALHCTVESV
jgi:hypothetical protein